MVYTFDAVPNVYFLRMELVRALSKQFPEKWRLRGLLQLYEGYYLNCQKIKRSAGYRPYEVRDRKPDGTVTRGPNWSAADVERLRIFFGQDPAQGIQPTALTEVKWRELLMSLEVPRTREAVHGKLMQMNRALTTQLLRVVKLSEEDYKLYHAKRFGGRRWNPKPGMLVDKEGNLVGPPKFDPRQLTLPFTE